MRPRSKRANRRGSSLVEGALTTSAFLALVLGMVDLGDAVFQNHVVSEASRQGARIASVHGSLAPSGWNGGPWGTTAYSGAGNATDTIPTTIRNAGALTGLNPANVTISVQWPTGGNIALERGHCAGHGEHYLDAGLRLCLRKLALHTERDFDHAHRALRSPP